MPNITDRTIAALEQAIAERCNDWESGRMTSPSESDFVLDAERIFEQPLTQEGAEVIADDLHAAASEGKYGTHGQMAEHLACIFTNLNPMFREV